MTRLPLQSDRLCDWCAVNVGNPLGARVAVGGEAFELRCSWPDILDALREEWPPPTSDRVENQVFLILADATMQAEMIDECRSRPGETADAFAFPAGERSLFVSSADGRVGVTVIADDGCDEFGVPLFEKARWQAASHLMLRCERLGKFAIHAGAAARDGAAALLFGGPGRGKSTQLARLLARGWSMISDDRVLLSVREDRAVVEPFWRSIKVRQDVEEVPEVALLLARARPIRASRYLDPEHGESQRYTLFTPTGAEGGGPTEWSPLFCAFFDGDGEMPRHLGPDEAIRRVLGSSFLLSTSWPEGADATRAAAFRVARTLATSAASLSVDGRVADTDTILHAWSLAHRAP